MAQNYVDKQLSRYHGGIISHDELTKSVNCLLNKNALTRAEKLSWSKYNLYRLFTNQV